MSKKKKENNTRKIKVSLSVTDYFKKLDDILENFEALKRTGFFTGTEIERINSYDMQTMHILLSRMINKLKEADQYLEQDIKPEKIKLIFVR